MNDLLNNFLNPNTWKRILLTALFWIILSVLVWVLGATIFVQLMFVLLTGQSNQQVLTLSRNLDAYLKQIVSYSCFDSDEQPFPFSDFPNH